MRTALKRAAMSILLLLAASGLRAQPRPEALEPVLLAEDAREPAAAALASAADSPDPVQRARAAVAWGRIMKPAGIGALRKLAEDPAVEVRRAAVFALGQFGWTAEAASGREAEIVATLQERLRDADEGTRVRAVEALGKVALDSTANIVTPLLKDGSAVVRAEAALALYRHRLVLRLRAGASPPATLPDLSPEALAALLEAVRDGDATVRRNVAYYFARVKDSRGLAAVSTLARDTDPEVRVFAVTALGRAEDAQGGPVAAAAAKDPDERVRIAAVQALVALRQGSLVPEALAKDPSQHVRAAVADAIGSDEKSDGSVLDALWKDESSEVRASALKALIQRKRLPVLDLLGETLGDPSAILREAAVQAAAELGADGEPFLRRALSDPDELVRATAIDSLGAQETAAGWAAIQSALGAAGIAERGTAAEALRNRKEADAAEVAGAAYRASGETRWVEVRETLVDILASKPGAVSEAVLREALADPAPSVSNKARAALETRGLKDLPAAVATESSQSPHRSLRFPGNPVITFQTTKGVLKVEGFADAAPMHVANLVGLVRSGFYDGLLWHRVVPNFVIQGGDPLGTGWGDAGWTVRAEVNEERFSRGTLGMPRSQGFDTGSCQLFFTLAPTPHLDGQYTVFGRVVEGVSVMDRIERGDRVVKASIEE